MDYYLNVLLIDPIELEFIDDIKKTDDMLKKNTVPDLYRPFLFNNSQFVITNNVNDLVKSSNTKEKYWNDNYDIIEKLTKLINKYSTFPKHYLTKSLENNENLPNNIKKYYKKIYDIVDIIIIKFINSQKCQIITKPIKLLLDNNKKTVHIIFRLSFYLSSYFIKESIGRRYITMFIQTIISKTNELNASPNISEYFTKSEMDNYLIYFNKYNDKHIASLKHMNPI